MNNPSAFPIGEPNNAYAQYFDGQSYLAPLASDGTVQVSNVTFEPGCTNHWHIHHKSCQILLAVGGRGWYQVEGQPAHALRKTQPYSAPLASPPDSPGSPQTSLARLNADHALGQPV